MSLRSAILGLAILVTSCSSNDGEAQRPQELTPGGAPYPCAVQNVLASKCYQCHGTTPVGAPMSLTDWNATRQVSQTISGAGKPVAQLIYDRINSPNHPMPPVGSPALSPEEKDALNSWLVQNAPEGDGSQCTPPTGSGGAPNYGTGGNVWGGAPGNGGIPNPWGGASTSGGTSPMGGAGGVGVETGGAGGEGPLNTGGSSIDQNDRPVPPEPGECEMTSIRARADASGAPFQVPANFIDAYICFEFALNFDGPTQGLQFKPHVPNAFAHHWLLYKKKPGIPSVNGANTGCIGLHVDGELLAGWAPGAGDWNLPKHVGMDLGSGNFVLEVHYNNTGAATPDDTGVDVCMTKNLRPETASIHWLGTEAIFLPPKQKTVVANTCTPATQKPIHVLRSWPHMHLLGSNMKATILRAGGAPEPLFNFPFDFNNQIQYDTPAVLQPGDKVVTECEFTNDRQDTVTFGEGTQSEMCYNFVVAYPANSLISIPSGLHSNSCAF